MDKSHSSLSHQIEVVESLVDHYDQITVLTGASNWIPSNTKIRVISTNWRPNQPLRNVCSFYFHFIRIYILGGYKTVFSHMTVMQSCLVAPILRIFRTKHLLWYAHASESVFLWWSSLWVNQILTSTEGSCPIKSEKVKYLGQMIDDRKFPQTDRLPTKRESMIHVGRLDPSKNIHSIIESVFQARELIPGLTLTFVGNPSNSCSSTYMQRIFTVWGESIKAGWLRFEPAVPRDEIAELLSKFDFFIHAFQGSLDKSTVEATMVGVPVITSNLEYQNIFGVWGHPYRDLKSEIMSACAVHENELSLVVASRRKLAIAEHSLNQWVKKFLEVAS